MRPFSDNFITSVQPLGKESGIRGRGHMDGLVQEKRNSSALAMELRLSCTNPSIWWTSIWCHVEISFKWKKEHWIRRHVNDNQCILTWWGKMSAKPAGLNTWGHVLMIESWLFYDIPYDIKLSKLVILSDTMSVYFMWKYLINFLFICQILVWKYQITKMNSPWSFLTVNYHLNFYILCRYMLIKLQRDWGNWEN